MGIKITHSNDIFTKKASGSKKYDPILFFYSCGQCNREIYAEDVFPKQIESFDSIEEINNYFRFPITEYDLYINSEFLTFLRKEEFNCPQCSFPLDGIFLHYIEKDPADTSIRYYESLLVDSFSLDPTMNGFLGLGVDIYLMISKLFIRWWAKGYKIDCIIPFIQRDFFDIFMGTLKYSIPYAPKLSNIKLNPRTNPFERLIFRKIQNKKPYRDIKSIISSFSNEKVSSEIQEEAIAMISKSIYVAANPNLVAYESEKHLKYQDNFHAKFICGYNENKSELLLTSYNFSEYQDMQFDTVILDEIDAKEYSNQITMFLDYHRLKIEKLEG